MTGIDLCFSLSAMQEKRVVPVCFKEGMDKNGISPFWIIHAGQ
jgi:hypothetical protein